LVATAACSHSARTGGQIGEQDRTFVQMAAAGGLAEVAAGNLAQQRALNPNVRAFGAQMVNDHTIVNNRLMAIASQEGVTPPTAPDEAHVVAAARLQQLSGDQFDYTYMQQQLQDHEKTIQVFQQEASTGQAPNLKAFAVQTMPILQHHLDMAEQIMSR
jgi:putative membrane protein